MSEAPEAAAAKVREVAPGVLEIFLPLPSKPSIINVFLVDCGDDRWALIDTGVALEASRTAFAGALAMRGIASENIEWLLATHHHPDHFGASAAFRTAGGQTVHLHSLEVERMEHSFTAGAGEMVVHARRHGMPIPPDVESGPRPAEVWAGTFEPTDRIDHRLEDGEVLTLGRRRFQVIWTPGHTPGHCCFLELDQGILFVGDHLLPKITPHVGVFAWGPQNPLGDFLDSQEKVAALMVNLVCPAHGPVFEAHEHRARQIIAHHEHRLREAADAIRPRPLTAFETAQRLFPWVYSDPDARMQWGAALMETIAHLELLHARGEATREETEERIFFGPRAGMRPDASR
jgi:glyoxylase-like metal-dependent hydrolase (beta-lactamase superfamily II)